jgi:small subunit ribosomal protein S20
MSQIKKAPKKRSKSVLKRQRQTVVRREANKATRSRMRTVVKKLRTLLDEEKPEAKAVLPTVEAAIDRTARKGGIHWKTAARYKSRLAKRTAKIKKAE